MRLKLKAVALVAGAALLLAGFAAIAYAATPAPQQTVALQVGAEQGTGYSGSYGDLIELTPASMSSVERPGEKFHFQIYASNVDSQGVPVGMQWIDTRDFEDVQLEDTNTVQPFSYQLGIEDALILGDGTVVIPTPPYQIRCEYKALDSSGTANSTSGKSFSETETVNVDKNTSTRVSINTSGKIKHAGTTFNFMVSPDSGPGALNVTIKKTGAKTLTYKLTTDEDGLCSAKLKLGSKNGTYKISARFLGNVWGSASPTANKSIKAAH